MSLGHIESIYSLLGGAILLNWEPSLPLGAVFGEQLSPHWE